MMSNFKILTLVQCTFISRLNYYIAYQTKINKKSLHTLPVVPAMVYTNADLDKESIIKDNKGKAGIYRWINKKNAKTYIGSAVNLTRRLYLYYNLEHISKSNMTIYKALLKYGYSNFQLEILEYCEAKNAIEREQHYMDTCKPEYNILKVAGSFWGYKHTEATLAKLSKIRIGTKLSEETRAKVSAQRKGVGGIKVWVTNIETGIVNEYASLVDVAKAIDVKSHHTIKKYLISGQLLRAKYFIGAKKDMPLPQSNSCKSNNSVAMPVIVTNVKTNCTSEYICS
jgi:hypothetical protein